jgi:hypothetical protein
VYNHHHHHHPETPEGLLTQGIQGYTHTSLPNVGYGFNNILFNYSFAEFDLGSDMYLYYYYLMATEHQQQQQQSPALCQK